MGCGVVAGYGHLPAIRDTPGLKLHAVFDPDPARARATQEKFGAAHAFTDAAAFFASGISSVSVTSPAPCHVDNVTMAAAHGVDVLCEKPLAMNAAEGQRMVDAMHAAGRVQFVGFTYRFSAVSQTIKRLLRERAIGTPRLLRLIYNWDLHGRTHRSGEHAGQYNQRRHLRMVEGGPMVDCGVHQIDLARWWLGSEVVDWQARGAWIDDGGFEAPDYVNLHLHHADGAQTTVEIGYAFGHTSPRPYSTFVYELVGSDGLIRFHRETGLFQLVNSSGVTDLGHGEEKGFHTMYAAYAHAIAERDLGEVPTGEDALAVTQLARGATDHVIATRRAASGSATVA